VSINEENGSSSQKSKMKFTLASKMK